MERRSQNGSINIVLTLLCCLVCFLIVQFLKSRTSDALNAEMSNALRVDKLLVEAASRNSIDCSSLPTDPCAGPVDLNDKFGRPFLLKDGSRKIGRWNVRLACGADDAYWIQTSIQKKDKSFAIDPLTKKTLQWADLVKLESSCKSTDPLLLEKSCYGFYDGLGPLPKEVLDANQGVLPDYKYCVENQIDFPQCPDGRISCFPVRIETNADHRDRLPAT